MNNNFTQEDKNDIFDCYNNGMKVIDIAFKYHVDERDIRILLKDNKIDRKNYNSLKPEIYDRIIELYTSGYIYKDIEEICQVSEACIRKTLNKNGIQRRSYSENNRRYHRNQHYFDVINTPNKAYILGMLFADGNNLTSHNTITIALQERDRDVLSAIKNELEYEGDLYYEDRKSKHPNHQNVWKLVVNDEYLSKRLNELGVVNAKSLILQFPDYLTDELIPHFIRGYFDGDGCIWNNDKINRSEVQITGTLEMCEGIKNYLDKYNVKSSIFYPKQSRKLNSNTYILKIVGTPSVYKFCKIIYNNSEIKMYRKYQKYLYMCENYNPGYKPRSA